MTVENTIARVEKEISDRRLWRAKEMLRSSISKYGYSPPVLQKLGEVLLAMNDDLEAGKYLLLTLDAPKGRELAAIDLFLQRFGNQKYPEFLKHFPKRTRLANRDEYPELLRSILIEKGAPSELMIDGAEQSSVASNVFEVFFVAGCWMLMTVALVCFAVGAYTVLRWLY